MQYWMTIECGGWWGEAPDMTTKGWGVSESQKVLAKRVAEGDILIHYISVVRAWAGYSTVFGSMGGNKRDSDHDWRDALPYVIPINEKKWLNIHECELTSKNGALHDIHYQRKKAFTPLAETAAKRIIEAIDAAKDSRHIASDEFKKLWDTDAESYYWKIARTRSTGKCWICGETAVSWVARHAKLGTIGASLVEKIGEGFVDMAHITARKYKGKVSPDNIRGLCPNCHRIVDRIPDEIRHELLRVKAG